MTLKVIFILELLFIVLCLILVGWMASDGFALAAVVFAFTACVTVLNAVLTYRMMQP